MQGARGASYIHIATRGCLEPLCQGGGRGHITGRDEYIEEVWGIFVIILPVEKGSQRTKVDPERVVLADRDVRRCGQ